MPPDLTQHGLDRLAACGQVAERGGRMLGDLAARGAAQQRHQVARTPSRLSRVMHGLRCR